MAIEFGHNTRKLREIMTAAPMSAELHAHIMRQRTEARHRIEDALYRARERASNVYEEDAASIDLASVPGP